MMLDFRHAGPICFTATLNAFNWTSIPFEQLTGSTLSGLWIRWRHSIGEGVIIICIFLYQRRESLIKDGKQNLIRSHVYASFFVNCLDAYSHLAECTCFLITLRFISQNCT